MCDFFTVGAVCTQCVHVWQYDLFLPKNLLVVFQNRCNNGQSTQCVLNAYWVLILSYIHHSYTLGVG